MTTQQNNYWDRQLDVVMNETNLILNQIRDGYMFKDWDTHLKKVLSVSLFPAKCTNEKGEWTSEGREALYLMRHLIFGANFIRPPHEIKNMLSDIQASELPALNEIADTVRKELLVVTPPFLMTDLIGK